MYGAESLVLAAVGEIRSHVSLVLAAFELKGLELGGDPACRRS
jgi:hypothetical protein